MLYNPMIRSQFCGRPGLLGCNLHKIFLDYFSPHSVETGGLEEHGVGYFSSSWLVSWALSKVLVQ